MNTTVGRCEQRTDYNGLLIEYKKLEIFRGLAFWTLVEK
jgi:hypothetical protein